MKLLSSVVFSSGKMRLSEQVEAHQSVLPVRRALMFLASLRSVRTI